ncbi:hypothetical protein [Roseofilum sp. Belize Diploria]|uniref:hypothetical protein n=1 Tax=Roseofilum sp. Belize Diploria TaxID=2821501 RepID=UPI001B06AB48|nr:hypothetical protein [Roseofilum sp. Belize Diploria]MBP0008822.1 hypothetical protein [Roseofilum sp. Belize Diploria]
MRYAKIESTPENYTLELLKRRLQESQLLLAKIKRRLHGEEKEQVMDRGMFDMIVRLNEQMISNVAMAVVELERYKTLDNQTDKKFKDLIDIDNINKEEIKTLCFALSERVKSLETRQGDLLNTRTKAIAKLDVLQWIGGGLWGILMIWLAWLSSQI